MPATPTARLRASRFPRRPVKDAHLCSAPDGRWVLFDNIKDTYQQYNLIDDPAQSSLIDHYHKRIAA